MYTLTRLKQITAALRDDTHGCPWDLEQDFKSIAAYTIEEAYEVADAIEHDDMRALKDELGDLLFQVMFHSQLASEIDAFDLDDVIDGICSKMIRRHPHVFAGDKTRDKTALRKAWERHKQDERIDTNAGRSAPANSCLDGVVSALPALRWSQKLQQRAASAGFDWPNISPVFAKLQEEVAELQAEIARPDNQQRILDELGDVFFVCVNLAMHLQLNAEEALRHANRKFISRFTVMETLMRENGAGFERLTLVQMEDYWRQAKTFLAANEGG